MTRDHHLDRDHDEVLDKIEHVEESLPPWNQKPLWEILVSELLRMTVSYILLPGLFIMILFCIYHIICLFL